jgi:gamma-glutamylcyclotransferase (GGCT)/AIG2-like uncharacterized protein YtfP
MFHNGTINGLSCSTEGGSDTLALAELINDCEYGFIEDILPLIKHIIGDKINRLVFFENDGEITIVNEGLGMWEDGIWYSNDYHKKEQYTYNTTDSGGWVYRNGEWVLKSEAEKKSLDAKNSEKMYKVFVYGTLKKGYSNHYLLGNSKLLGKAATLSKWTMIGKDMPFPYLLEKNWDKGAHVKGELYEVDATTLAKLDKLEGVPTHYKREETLVQLEDDKRSINVITYVKAAPLPEVVLANAEYIEEFVA